MPLILDGYHADSWLIPDLTPAEMSDWMISSTNDFQLETCRVEDGVPNMGVNTNFPEVTNPV